MLRSFRCLKIAVIFVSVFVLSIYTSSVFAQTDVSALYKKVVTSVVLISTFDREGKFKALGTGFFIEKEGVLVTNFHVIEGAVRAQAKLFSGEVIPIEGILSENRERDLALLSLGFKGREFPVIRFSQSTIEVGQPVAVIGNPIGLEKTITVGIVSAVRYSQKYGKFIQISAPISAGSSGSPVVNMKGELVGVATSSIDEGQNLNFAVSVDMQSDLISYRQPKAGKFVGDSIVSHPPTISYSPTVELKYSIFFPAPHKNAVLAAEWAKEIEKRTGGKVKITMFYGGTLTPADKCYDGVVKGISDIGFSVLAYTRDKFPLTQVADLPLGMKSGLVATRVINEFYKKFKPKELDEVKVMYLHGHGPGILHTKKAVNKLEDLKGMKIRCTGLAAKIVAALGATPVPMPMGETYDALSRGVVDASMAPREALQGWRWGEVVKFTTENWGASYSSGMFVVMNKAKWNALSPDVQKIIEKVNEEYIEKQGKTWDEIDNSARNFATKFGNITIILAEAENERWVKRVSTILNEYVNNARARGLPGDEAINFCLNYLKKLQ